MLRDTNLKVLPSTTGSIKWSADGQLCIPLGDRVNIIANTCFNPQNVSPRMIFNHTNFYTDEDGEYELEDEEDDPNDNDSIASDKSEEDDDLDVVSFDAQFFLTTIDIHVVPELGVEHLEIEEFNLGDTIKPNEIVKLVWSPLGVGSDGRCVLCVLLSSCQLIFYEPQTVIGGDWKIVTDLCENIATAFRHDNRAQRRVKDLSWSQSCSLAGFSWGITILATTNFAHEIYLTYIRHGKVRVLTSCSVKGTQFSLKGLENLCWSPWVNASEHCGDSLFTYSCASRLYVRRVTLKTDGQKTTATLSDAIEVSEALTASHSVPGAAWYNKKLRSGSLEDGLVLAVVLQTKVEFYQLELGEGESVQKSLLAQVSLDIPDRVNGIYLFENDLASHLILNITTDNGRLVSIAYELTSKTAFVCKRSILPSLDENATSYDNESENGQEYGEEFSWLERVAAQQEAFAKKDNIAKVVCKVFGVDMSPFSAFLGAVYRRKPEGFVEYLTKEKGEAITLSFGNMRTCRTLLREDEDVLTCSTEALISAAEWLSNDASDSTTIAALDNIAVDKIELPAYRQNSIMEEDIRLYIHGAFHRLHVTKLRLRHSLAFLPDRKLLKTYTAYQDQHLILKYMTTLILNIPFHNKSKEEVLFVESKLSSTIRYLHILLGILGLYAEQEIFDAACKTLDQFSQHHDQLNKEEHNIVELRQRALADGTIYAGPASVSEKVYEVCACCEAPIVFDDFITARCATGHRYRRCALTFIALQNPHSRVCGICSREYVSREAIEEDANLTMINLQPSNQILCTPANGAEVVVSTEFEAIEKSPNTGNSRKTLAQILMESIEVCVYCGGHLYDKAARYGSGPVNSGVTPVAASE